MSSCGGGGAEVVTAPDFPNLLKSIFPVRVEVGAGVSLTGEGAVATPPCPCDFPNLLKSIAIV